MTNINFPDIHFPVQGIEDVPMPKMYRIREKYESDKIEDIKSHLEAELDKVQIDREWIKGKSIAITVGSRGIPNNALMVRTMCDKLKEWGAEPFIVPAMGSHGGGTVEGNLEVINGYGVTEEAMGVPIKASMEVVQIGNIDDAVKTPVYCDKYAAEADGIIVYNKVKPHTDFKGYVESGMCKMMAIGLAKHYGCSWFHQQGFDTFAERIPLVAKEFLAKKNIIFGVAVVQNAYDDISDIRVFAHDDIFEGDHEMLEIARRRFPRMKFDNIDVLVIDRIGKNISGEGADPNVTGRGFMPGFENDFHCKKLVIRGLTEQSHHNACGLGLADITTKRCLETVDFAATWINLTTNTCVHGGKIPVYQNTDFEAIRLAIRTSARCDFLNPRVARIKDTLTLNELEVSEAILPDIMNNPDVEIVEGPYEWDFGADGYMADFEVTE